MNYETLEDALSAFIAALEDERSANWKAGDIVSDIIETYGSKVIGKLAETANCSSARIYLLKSTSETFPPEVRSPEHSWSFHKCIGEKARTLGEDPIELLNKAIEEGWSLRDVQDYGRSIKSVNKSFECACGIKFTLRGENNLNGKIVCCPICLAKVGEL